jgi:hypothetical protein
MIRVVQLLPLVLLASCAYFSTENVVLRAFAREGLKGLEAGQRDTEYIGYADKTAEHLFGYLTRSGRYRLPPKGVQLVCPDSGVTAGAARGYIIGVGVSDISGDNALVTFWTDCFKVAPQSAPSTTGCANSPSLRFQTTYVMRRIGTEWGWPVPLTARVSTSGTESYQCRSAINRFPLILPDPNIR